MSANTSDQYVNLTNGMEVYDVAGEKVGKIIDVTDETILVEKGFFFPKDYLIPISLVDGVNEDDHVFLTLAKERLTEDLTAESSDADLELGGSTTFDPTIAAGAGIAPSEGGVSNDAAVNSEVISPDYVAETDERATPTTDATRVPVYEEQVTPVKRPVGRGAVRIQKDVVTENRTVTVPVTEERVRITRVDTDEPIAAGEDALESDTIDIPVQGEEVDLETTVRQTGEVVVNKEAVQHDETVTGTVRREEVSVDDETTPSEDASVHRNDR